MSLSELCVRRPVFTTVMTVMMVLIGAVSYQRLSVREYPNIDEPVVSIVTRYPGASPEIIESQVTQVIEGSVAGIEGIDVLTSSSRSESSRITARFRATVNPSEAASDVRDRVGRVRGRLPDAIDEPIITKVEADAQPIIYISFASKRHSSLQITDYLDRYIVDRLKNVDGVADVTIFGERRYAMRVWLDDQRLAAYQLTTTDVENALKGQNLELPSGRIESNDREFNVLSRTGLNTPEQFRQIVVKRADGMLVRVGDVARVDLGAADERRQALYNGDDAVTLGIVKQAVANPLDVSKGVRSRIDEMLTELPDGMTGEVAYDTSVFIDRSIKAVYHTILEAVIFVVLVIFLFLRSVRATLIPIITIPVSLITIFAMMFALGFTVNTLTLLAMVLAIGLVVDDAIVVLENVHRRIELGEKPFRAAIEGTKEIAFAVVAMTVTLAAVYAPLAFSTGRTGRLFIEFALTLAGSVIVSGFVALTLSPMMCSKILKEHETHNFLYRALEWVFETITATYRTLLKGALVIRPFVVVATILVAGAAVVLYSNLKGELSPVEDRGVIQGFGVAPEGSTLDFVLRYAQKTQEVYAKIPEVKSTFVIAGFPQVTNATAVARLVDWDERKRTQQQIVPTLFSEFARIPGVTFFANNPPSLGQGFSSRPIEFVIQTSGTYEDLRVLQEKMLEKVRAYPGLVSVDTDLKLNQPQVEVKINRDKILESGLQVETVGRTLETMLGGRTVNRFEMEGEQYDVIVQLAAANRTTPQALSSLYVRSPDGAMIQLSNLVDIKEVTAARELNRFNQMRSVTLTAALAPGYAQGEALAFLDRAADEVLPKTARTDVGGQSREFRNAGTSFMLILALAAMFIYLVLAAQFESFVDPFIIMLTVPVAAAGALYALLVTGGTWNVYSQIGIVTLIGLITKHGILIVEFANQLQEKGHSKREAIIEAATLRLRPILMTTGAMVLGAYPLAHATGAGAESRQQIGWVIVGGMSFGTLLTLFVVPVVYYMIAREHKRDHHEDLAPSHGHGQGAGGAPAPQLHAAE
ncbi:efflux RND transporter permease subunit [Prosthecomicrobium hirschii]|uniref:Multidrug transporter AcrB n=1 Tax=Prosthecodimorpha hirschii TaxID=665126 RepID=A0A0N8GFD7_9HYPH|nr:efflux RND transporter permease subunit [Prosthecomicrobium hirschii]KPL54033.1 multidrug transporter AcrB [Prosthecomicrobium hirschii]MCW1841186.1 efflux RND transporter permease subunit [Prosthecomicrobium hirschii]